MCQGTAVEYGVGTSAEGAISHDSLGNRPRELEYKSSPSAESAIQTSV
jgi:hypothetical protein